MHEAPGMHTNLKLASGASNTDQNIFHVHGYTDNLHCNIHKTECTYVRMYVHES